MAQDPPPGDPPPPVPELPPRVIIDLRTDCNLKCPMCIVHGDPGNPQLRGFLRRDMPLDKARHMLDELMAARPLVMPSLWSEPTLSRDFRAYVKEIKSRGMTLAMNTNGLTLREPLARFMVEHEVDAVSFSIDAVTKETLEKVRGIDKLDKLHEAVALMLRVRGGHPRPRIGVSFTVQPANRHERAAFVAHWAPRVDFVRVGELFENGRFPNVKVEGPRRPCPALYSTMAIHANGNVSLCCLDGFGETNVGNVFEEGVKAVWNGEKLNQVRRWHETGAFDKVPFCESCERWASYGFEETLEDNLLIRRSPEYTYYNRIDRLENWSGQLLGTHKDPKESLREKQAEPMREAARATSG
jgi:radical SAM protein with 4Fe4S-binding SPASM domain